MTEEFIRANFCEAEIAKQMREMGFNEPCFGYYETVQFNYDDMFRNNETIKKYLSPGLDINNFYAAPLLQQAICFVNNISDAERMPTAYIEKPELNNPVLLLKEIADSLYEIKFIRASRERAAILKQQTEA